MPHRSLFLVLLLATAAAPAVAQETVRVRVLEQERPRTAAVRAQGGPVDLRLDGQTLVTLADGTAATLESERGSVTVRVFSLIETGDEVEVVPRPDAFVQVIVGRETRTYRGTLTAAADGRGARAPLLLINTVELEDYVASVVPGEYPFEEIEGVKAQAVLARTYALRSRGKYGRYDLVDHTGSQVYGGVASETETARRAVEATRGEVLTYGGALAEAVYSSSSGGHTADNEALWDGAPLPYLRGRPDPYDTASPNHRWTSRVERSRLLSALSRHYGFRVTGIAPAATSPEGRVTKVRLYGDREREVRANDFRLALNAAFGPHVLRSTFFEMEREGDRYVFRGRGFGHGVGMSQYGARAQAQQGRSYRDILAFYFEGTQLAHADEPLLADATPPPPRPAAPVTPAPVTPPPVPSTRPASPPARPDAASARPDASSAAPSGWAAMPSGASARPRETSETRERVRRTGW